MKVKIAAVSYTNTIPFIYGLKHYMDSDAFELKLEYPAKCADDLVNGLVDLALVPIAALRHLSDAHIVSDYCIGADGAVDTVCIYSEVPIEEVESLYLDYQSRSSVLLSKILLKEYWNLGPQLLHAPENFIEHIGGTTAGLVIGDRAFDLNGKFPYIYDLAKIWKDFTGLPFVFAAWVSNKPLDAKFAELLNNALSEGLMHIDLAIEELGGYADAKEMTAHYLNHRIDYVLDEPKREAMELYLAKADDL